MEANGPAGGDKKNKLHDTSEFLDFTSDNGYFLCDKFFIPEEVLALILSFVPVNELVFNCRRICKSWCGIIDTLVWRIKLRRINYPVNKLINELPWFTCFWIIKKQPLNRNLLRNNCGQEKLKYWDILSSGGDGWGVEKPPLGCDNLSENCETVKVSSDIITHNSCFVTSYYSCTKKQLIDLRKEGIYPEVIDKLQPRITISDWCSGRFDCGAIYDLKVTLLNENLETVADFEVRKHVGAADGTQWVKVSHDFTNYGPGVKFIEFYHGGMDSQFWKGHYGSKMTGSTVTVSFE